MSVEQLLGPLGLTIVLLVVGGYVGRLIIRFVWQLWQLHIAGDEKMAATNEVLVNSLPGISESLQALTAIVDERLTASHPGPKP